MFNRKLIVIAGLSLVLLLSTAAFSQEKGHRIAPNQKTTAGAKRKNGKYANQEVSYSKAKTADTNTSANEQSRLKKPIPKQQNLLPYMEQSNLRRRNAQARK